MSAQTGAIAGSVLVLPVTGQISTLWSGGRTGFYSPLWSISASQVATASRGNGQPTFEPFLVRAGTRVRQYSFDFYFRIVVTPVFLDYGNIVADTTKTVEIFNAYLDPVDITSVTGGGEGILFDFAPPTTLNAIQSRIYSVTATLDGPAAVDTTLVISFSTGDVRTVSLVGRRVFVFPYMPDWGDGIIERFEWLTDVIESYSGFEQRVRLRNSPRRTVQFNTLSSGASKLGFLDSLLFGWGGRAFAVPLWQDVSLLTANASAGDSTIFLDTSNREFYASSMLVLWADERTNEAVEVLSVSAGSVQLKHPLGSAWGVNSIVIPTLMGILRPSQDQQQHNGGVLSHSAVFDIVELPSITPLPDTTLFNGVPIFSRTHNFADALDRTYERKLELIDNPAGVREWFDRANMSRIIRRIETTFFSRAARHAFLQWLVAVGGRYQAFYWTNPELTMESALPQPINTAALVIKNIGFVQFVFGKPNRGAIALVHVNGTRYYRNITAAVVDIVTGNEILTLDSILPIAHSPSDWQVITYMELVRVDSDAIEFAHHSAEIASTAFPIKGVKQ